MQPALDALDRGVQQLFARPTRRRSLHHQQQQQRQQQHTPQHLPQPTPSGSASTRARTQHPLCECLALQPLPDDWQHLRRYSVLKRYVLSRWQELCSQYNHDAPQQQQCIEKQYDKLTTPVASVSAAYARRRATVVGSVNALCVLIYQCGLLHVREIEFVRLFVSKTLAHGLGDVLLLVRENQASELPLRVRMLLLDVVLQQVVLGASHHSIISSSDNSSNSSDRGLQRGVASQRLVEDLCTSLQEEVLEAMATKSARGKANAKASAGGATPGRTNASPGGAKKKRERRDTAKSAFAPMCEFCSQSDEPAGVSNSSSSTPWVELQSLRSTVQEILHGVESGGLFPGDNKSAAVSKLASLRNLLARSDVKTRLASHESARMLQLHVLQSTRPVPVHNSSSSTGALQLHQWTMSVARYKQIRWSTVSTLQKDCASTTTDINKVVWGNVWERELQRFAPAKHMRVCEIITHCAKVDFFTRIPSLSNISKTAKPHKGSSSSSNLIASLPGYRLVCQVLRALQIDCFAAIGLFLQAWNSIANVETLPVTGYHRHSRIPESYTTTTMRANNSIAAVCRSYLEQLLSESERRVGLGAEDSTDGKGRLTTRKTRTVQTPVNGEQLVALLHSLYTIFADALVCDDDGGGSRRPPYCRHWDRIFLLVHHWMGGSADSDAHSAGLRWLSVLVLCSKLLYTASEDNVGETYTLQQHGAFKTAFASYVQRIIRAIVVENGRSISSGADDGTSFRELLVRTEEDLRFVREAVTSIAVSTVSSERRSQRWVCDLAVQLLQTQMHDRSRAWSMELSRTYRRGLDQLFFPALAAVVKAVCRSQHSDPQGQGRMNASEDEENQFFAILSHVAESLKARYGSHVVTATLLGFCTDWDAHQLKAINGARGKRRPFRRLWGRASLLKLNVFPDILRIYESESALADERGEVLQFLRDVLQGVTNCPSALEGKLFHVLSSIKSHLENKRPIGDSAGGGGSTLSLSGGDPQDIEELPTSALIPGTSVKQIGPISHASDPLAKFMYQLQTGTILQVREAVEQMKSDAVALEYLIQHVLRWVGLMQLNDPRAAFGKETKLSFAVFCNRLMCWLPDEMIHEIRQAVSQVDQNLIYALTAFAESYGSHFEDHHAMGISTGSSVRLELLIRSFVYSFVVPDLCELTDVVMNAIISCTSTKSRDALMKMTQRISNVLLVEVAIETLRLSLSTECLLYLDRANQQRDPYHQMSDEGDESVNRLSNALSIVGLSSVLFSRHDISWSTSLFNEQAVQHWLLCFFDCMVYSEQSRALTPVDELLSSLEFLMQQSPNGERMTKHSYLLAALLCTASFPQSRIPQALWSDFDTSLLEITRAILAVLSPPKASNGAAQEDNECEILFVQVDPLRVARAKVLEERMDNGFELPVDARSCTALTKRLQNGYLDGQESNERVDREGIRVLVRFNTWLASAIIYSQSIAATLTTNNNGGGEENSWEHVFADYVVYLYLPLEFGNSVSRLLAAWVSVWMRMNLEQRQVVGGSGESLNQLLLLLPFQQKLFSRLSATQPPQRSEDQSLGADPVWKLVLTCVHRALRGITNAPDALDAAIVVLDDVIEKFDLVNLSTMTASRGGRGAFVQSELLAHEFETLCSHQNLALLSDIQTIHVLKYPLELVAFCHVTATLEGGDPPGFFTLPASSWQWDLEHVLAALRSSIHGQEEESSSPSSSSDTEHGHGNVVKLSEEMTAFWYEWTQMIQLKYAYMDPTRCEQFILAATQAVSGQALAQP